jgi:hypothetical protein
MYPWRTWNQPIWATVSLLSGSFVSPVINQLSMPFMIMQRVVYGFGLFEVPVQVYYNR